MTIPIIPGPFSFLATAGQAVGQIGQAMQAKRDRAKQKAMDMIALAGQGADVSIPAFLEIANQAQIPIDAAGATQLFDMAKRRARAALTTAEAGASTAGSTATITGAEADVAGPKAQAGLQTAQNQATITSAQAGVAPQVAQAGARQATAEATTAEATALAAPDVAAATGAQARLHKDIYDTTLNLLGDPKNEALQRVATYAAVGGLPYLTQLIENNRYASAELRNDANLLMQTMSQAQATYQQQNKEWEQGLSMAAFQQNINLTGPEGAKFIESYETSQPRPNRDAIVDDVLGQFGMTRDQFKKASGRVFPRIFGAETTGVGGAAAGSGPTSGQRNPVGDAAKLLINNPTAEMADRLIEAVKSGAVTPLQARAIIAAAKRSGKVPENVIRRLEIEIPQE